MNLSKSIIGVTAVIVCALTGAILLVASQTAAPGRVEIRAVSTRPELVSGGDVLIEVLMPGDARGGRLTLAVNGRDTTAAFKPGRHAHTMLGLVKDLQAGTNTIEAGMNGQKAAALTVVNHPITGPVISGPHQTPFICETEAFGLGPALDQDCSAKTKVEYRYRAKDGTFKALDPSAKPADLVRTTTIDGNTIDYIVRLETGTINRAVYQIAFLHQPGQPLPDPWTSTPGWNGRLVYSFGGGCSAGYHQGRTTGGVIDPSTVGDRAIAAGFAIASTSLNVFGTDCNDTLSAESAMMLKEYLTERFGAPRYTIGTGGSGGSMQQNLIARNYPGLLDGILPEVSFPDAWTFFVDKFDCALLVNAFDTWANTWTPEQRTAVAGHRTFEYCRGNGPSWVKRFSPSAGCNPAVPQALVYDPVKNAKGVRCTVQDNQVNIFGRDPATTFARRPLDNVGVQYGLAALNAGTISFDQFAELNARIGGYDIDGNFVTARTAGDPSALSAAYRTGQVNSGAGLDSVPIFDVRRYQDPIGDVHDTMRSYIMRARLVAANGHANNHVIWTTAPSKGVITNDELYSSLQKRYYEAVLLMDRWLSSIASDAAPGTKAQKVARHKPAEAVDACFTEADAKVTDQTKCAELYPRQQHPRTVAGAPLTDDILKCQLKPAGAADYAVPLNTAQIARLKTIFPGGVCDYSRPGVGQQPAATLYPASSTASSSFRASR
jgi:hypothetical protein